MIGGSMIQLAFDELFASIEIRFEDVPVRYLIHNLIDTRVSAASNTKLLLELRPIEST